MTYIEGAEFKLDGRVAFQWKGMPTLREVSVWPQRTRDGRQIDTIMVKVDGNDADTNARQQVKFFFSMDDSDQLMRAIYKILKEKQDKQEGGTKK